LGKLAITAIIMIKQIYATKVSMSQVFLEGKRTPVTLLKVPIHTVVGQRTEDLDGYTATIIGIGKTKKPASKPLSGQLKRSGLKFTPKYLKELRSEDGKDLASATDINLEEILIPGSTISATGTSKGMGFTGTIKRWNFATGPRTHGQSDRRRAPGSIGRGTTPGRVLPGKKMAGRHGNQMINLRNLKIVSFNNDSGDLVISGSVPGARNSQVKISITKQAKSK
jgi:large subunit ribosomal protein L3